MWAQIDPQNMCWIFSWGILHCSDQSKWNLKKKCKKKKNLIKNSKNKNPKF